MSGYLYKSYCYETSQQVADSIHSSFFLEGFGVIQSVSGGGSSLTVNYLNLSGNLSSFSYSLVSCEKMGFDNSFSGLTKEDTLLLSGSMIAVLVSAWAIKIVRRAL
jgi:hypothetical protein